MKKTSRVTRIWKTTVAITLSAIMTMQGAQSLCTVQAAVNPSKVNEATGKFIDAMAKFSTDTTKVQGLQLFMTRLGGVSSIASGAIGILQMAGVIKDPTAVKLGQILNDIHNIQDQLNQMDVKLDNLNHQLLDVAVEQKGQDRSNRATQMLDFWRNFKRDYMQPLDNRVNEYKGMVNDGIRTWWQQETHDGVRVNYTTVEETRPDPEYTWMHPGFYPIKAHMTIDVAVPYLTYSNGRYADGMPATADNGEAISKDYSFGVPAEVLPNTASKGFNINTYRDVFEDQMANNLYKAANERTLDASKAFFDEWDKLSENDKRAKARLYASDILNTIIYHIACDVMSNNNQWVVSTLNAYRNYCDNIMEKDSGVNAMINAMYCTHGFEGEIKDDLTTFLDAMVAKTGFYGEFALTCACQDDMQSITDREDVQDQFADTIISLDNRKDKALTGHDNFCYVTGTLVEFGQTAATSKTTIKMDISRAFLSNTTVTSFKGATAEGWKCEIPNMMDNVYAQVLYRQYRALNQGHPTFASYLNSFGTGVPGDYSGVIMTRYGGQQTFSPGEGLWLMADKWDGSYFDSGITYRVNVGNSSSIENNYFCVHDKIVYDGMNMNTGAMNLDAIGGARAVYGESHGSWYRDEVCMFYSNDCKVSHDYGTDRVYDLRVDFNVLKLSQCKDVNGGEDDDDPFFAFDGFILDNEYANQIGPMDTVTGETITFETDVEKDLDEEEPGDEAEDRDEAEPETPAETETPEEAAPNEETHDDQLMENPETADTEPATWTTPEDPEETETYETESYEEAQDIGYEFFEE